MRKKINGVLFDTATASLITETKGMTAFSGRVSVELYRSHSGQWFQCISPSNGRSNRTMSNWISPHTAKSWLKKHSFNLQIREYFGIPENRLWPQRQVLVAERKSPNSTSSHDLILVEKLYHHPKKGWCLKQTKESVLKPLTAHEAAKLIRSLQQKKEHTQTPLPFLEQYFCEGGHLGHRGVAS